MNQFRTAKYLAILVFACMITSCATQNKISNQNIAFIYKNASENPQISISLFQYSSDSSRLFIKLNPSQFLSVKQGDASFLARASVKVQIFSSFETEDYNTVPDSAVFQMYAQSGDDSLHEYISDIRFKSPLKDSYLIKLILIDQNKSKSIFYYYQFDHNLDPQNRYSFLFQKPASKLPYFKNYLGDDELFSLTNRDSSKKKFPVNYYKRNFPLAEPPFSVKSASSFDYKPDSAFFYDAGSLRSFSGNGFYHFRIDTSGKEGFTLFRFDNQFPRISMAKELIEPLRYLTAKKEYDEMITATDKKKAADHFWLKIGGNPDRAKQLIRKFYSRVQESNNFFTSYLQGWKSDRGMIYIVFGVPNAVYKTNNAETWIFGDPGNLQSIVFTFVKVINPFTDNDYQLSRSIIYQPVWYLAVEAWREGRIFNDN
jgi:GWxTD domain-containing protein